MEESTSFGEFADVVVKSRNSSGCLVVRKKADRTGGGVGVGTSMHRQNIVLNKEKKRARLVGSDSEFSDEQLDPYRRRVLSRGGNVYENGIGERGHEAGRVTSSLDHNGYVNGGDESGRDITRFNVNKFDGYRTVVGKKLKKHMDESDDEGARKSFSGSKFMPANGIRRDFESGSSQRGTGQKRNHSYFDRESDYVNDRCEMNRYEADKPIRVQGKNGVLKVMPNKIKKGNGLLRPVDHSKADLRHNSIVKSNELFHSYYSEPRIPATALASFGTEKHIVQRATIAEKKKSLDWESDTNTMNLKKSPATNNSKDLSLGSDGIDTSLKLGRNSSKLKTTSKINKAFQRESYKSDSSFKMGQSKLESDKPVNLVQVKGEITPTTEKAAVRVSNAAKVRRGSGTEKQKLREQIRKMLLDSGWTIDYKPRKNRDYQDAVYTSPSGTCYWSIIKAYEALQKQFVAEDSSLKPDAEGSLFSPISENVLRKLTRQTQKKIEKEMKRKKRLEDVPNNPPESTFSKYAKHDHDTVRTGGIVAAERSSSFVKQGSVSLKDRTCEKLLNQNEKKYTSEDNLKGDLSHRGAKIRKLSRCTLVVSSTKKGLNLESDGYVPYTGKLTVISWLIDSGTVREGDKVQYMNCKQTRVMQEGWITRDGIHCGCCSKILTVAKFEIHAGSKLRQPFQNTYLDSGISLQKCQMDAWNREVESKRSTFHSVYVDNDDPNDDTCGICGDGGDLICCDGCPSTFHQTCLGIQMLPTGDWHCSNCTCRFCGMAGSSSARRIEISECSLPTCSLCEKKYHQSCIQEVDTFSIESNDPSFCGQTCRELFETLQKFIGVKHELDGGFSWSLIHRTDTDSDASGGCLIQRVECNSKLAIALTVMDECFLPIVDRRSGVNLIHNVLYNWGSKLSRVNYSGFYTAILERGDEIISTASIRFHGTQIVEMPFIGTRHIYRRQGMCHRLFRAIESALRSFKVGRLIIPAISELKHTWTEVFGFKYLDDSQKVELRSMNMLVFLGIDMLGKKLTPDEKRNVVPCTGEKSMELECEQISIDEIPSKTAKDNGGDCTPHVGLDSASQGSGDTLNDAFIPATSLDTQVKVVLSSDKVTCLNSQSVQVTESATESVSNHLTKASNTVLEHDDNSKLGSIVDDGSKSFSDTNVSKEYSDKFVSVDPVSHSVEYISVQNKDDTHVSFHGQEDKNEGQCNPDLGRLDICSGEDKRSDASKANIDSSAAGGFQTGSPSTHNSSESTSVIDIFEDKSQTQSIENPTDIVSETTLLEKKPTGEVNIGSEDGTMACVEPALHPS